MSDDAWEFDARGALDEDDEEECWTAWEDHLDPFDLLKTLQVRAETSERSGTRITGGDAAIRAAFHKRSWHKWPGEEAAYADKEVYTKAVIAFRRVCLAFTVLRDPERRRIYLTSNFSGLQQSEVCQEESVFDIDPMEVYNNFFEGVDEADREYLLLNGADVPSDDEVWSADDDGHSGGDSDSEAGEGSDELPEVLLNAKAPLSGEEREEGLRQLERRLTQPPPPPPVCAAAAGSLLVASTPGSEVPAAAHNIWEQLASRDAGGVASERANDCVDVTAPSHPRPQLAEGVVVGGGRRRCRPQYCGLQYRMIARFVRKRHGLQARRGSRPISSGYESHASS
jgi:hypothetical protein